MGLVEVGVGLVPAWGGCKEMITRWNSDPKQPKGPMANITKIFQNVGTAKVASSAQEAKEMNLISNMNFASNEEVIGLRIKSAEPIFIEIIISNTKKALIMVRLFLLELYLP